MSVFIVLALLFSLLAVSKCLQKEWSTKDDEEIISLLPKVELHAHLSGSVRLATLRELYEQTGGEKRDLTVKQFSGGQVEKPFELFPLIHQSIQTRATVLRVLSEMIEDYMHENSVYLEIRTSPRQLSDGTTPEEYVDMLVTAIEEHNDRHGHHMLVKLILSIDRSKSYQNAVDVLTLLKKQSKKDFNKTIVGLDFSGNPMGGKFSEFSSLFVDARHLGFNLTVHTAEAPDESLPAGTEGMEDTDYILSFRPDRLGHMLHLKERHLRLLWKMNEAGTAPLIEICPSTSFFVLNLRSFADHPFLRKFRSMNYPVSINTDDSAIFNTSITKEILHVKSALDWKLSDAVDVQVMALQYAFASPSEKIELFDRFWRSIDRLREKFPRSELDEIQRPSSEKPEIDMSSLYTM